MFVLPGGGGSSSSSGNGRADDDAVAAYNEYNEKQAENTQMTDDYYGDDDDDAGGNENNGRWRGRSLLLRGPIVELDDYQGGEQTPQQWHDGEDAERTSDAGTDTGLLRRRVGRTYLW